MPRFFKRADTMTFLGIALIIVGLCFEIFSKTAVKESFGQSIGNFINFAAFFLILFASLGATALGHEWSEMKLLPRLSLLLFKAPELEAEKTINLLVGLSEKARREGLLRLEDELRGIGDSFLRDAIQLVIDGTDMELLQKMLATKVESMRERHKKGEMFFMDWGGFAPTIGIIGTVMGLVHVLLGLGSGNMNELGAGIARAFLATFYGIASANLFLLPAAGKLRMRSQEETFMREMMIEGVLSIQAGDNPRLLKEKLLSYLPPKAEPKVKRMESARMGGGARAENMEMTEVGGLR